MRKKRVHVYLDDTLNNKVINKTKKENISISSFISKCIEFYFIHNDGKIKYLSEEDKKELNTIVKNTLNELLKEK